jgi:hypothetical protein
LVIGIWNLSIVISDFGGVSGKANISSYLNQLELILTLPWLIDGIN